MPPPHPRAAFFPFPFAQAVPLGMPFPPSCVQAPPTHGTLCSGLPPLGSLYWPARLHGYVLPLPQRPQIFCFVSLISPSLNDLICFPWCQRPFLFYVPRASMDWTCAIAIWTVSLVNEWVESEPRNMLTGNLVRPRGSLVVKESARRGHICWGEHGGSTWIWP